MTSSSPRVSIGLPVYNGERFLARTLDSLLAQTFRDFEIVICDNASDDDTREICLEYARRDPRIRYHRNDRNLGAARNYNRTFDLAVGTYFKWAAHDDWCDPSFLARCVSVLDADPDAVLCYTGTVYVDADGTPLKMAPIRDLGSSSAVRRGVTWLRTFECTPPVFGLIRAEELSRTGLIRPQIGGDKVLLTELILLGPWRMVRDPLLHCFVNRRRNVTEKDGERSASSRGYSISVSRTTWWDPDNADRLPVWRWRMLGNLLLAVLFAPVSIISKASLSAVTVARCVRADGPQMLTELRMLAEHLMRTSVGRDAGGPPRPATAPRPEQ